MANVRPSEPAARGQESRRWLRRRPTRDNPPQESVLSNAIDRGWLLGWLAVATAVLAFASKAIDVFDVMGRFHTANSSESEPDVRVRSQLPSVRRAVTREIGVGWLEFRVDLTALHQSEGGIVFCITAPDDLVYLGTAELLNSAAERYLMGIESHRLDRFNECWNVERMEAGQSVRLRYYGQRDDSASAPEQAPTLTISSRFDSRKIDQFGGVPIYDDFSSPANHFHAWAEIPNSNALDPLNAVNGSGFLQRNLWFTDDNACAIVALRSDARDSLRCARLIGDGLVYAMQQGRAQIDNCTLIEVIDPLLPRSLRLRSAYEAGDLFLAPGWTPKNRVGAVTIRESYREATQTFCGIPTEVDGNHHTTVDGFSVIDFTDDRDGVWFEGTAQFATIVMDAFSDADGTLLTAHAPDSDAMAITWVVSGATATPMLEPVGLGVFPRAGRVQALIKTGSADVSIGVDYVSGMGGLAFRISDANDSLLLEKYLNHVYLFRHCAGDREVVSNQPLLAGLVAGSTHQIELRTQSAGVEGWCDAALLVPMTEAFQNTETRHGVDFNSTNDVTTTYGYFILVLNAAPPSSMPIGGAATRAPMSAAMVSTIAGLTSTATGPTTYDVQFGATNPPPVANRVASSSVSPGPQANTTTYFWQAVAQDPLRSVGGPHLVFATGRVAVTNGDDDIHRPNGEKTTAWIQTDLEETRLSSAKVGRDESVARANRNAQDRDGRKKELDDDLRVGTRSSGSRPEASPLKVTVIRDGGAELRVTSTVRETHTKPTRTIIRRNRSELETLSVTVLKGAQAVDVISVRRRPPERPPVAIASFRD